MNTAFVDISRINENYSLLSKRKEIYCVVKSDAYGHGLLPVAEALFDSGARRFCVVYPEEGMTLLRRFAGSEVLFLTLPDAAFLPSLAEAGAVFSVSDAESAARIAFLGQGARSPIKVHIALDCGMSRLGFSLTDGAYEQTVETVTAIAAQRGVRVTGAYSHLPVQEGHLYDRCLSRFFRAVTDLSSRLPDAVFHLAATPTYGRRMLPRALSARTLSRVGLALYGYGFPGVRPAMTVRSAVARASTVPLGEAVGYGGDCVLDRDRPMATVAIGYADGMPRLATGAFFTSGGVRLPIAGRISMNLTTVFADGISLRVGDTVTVLGPEGEETEALCRASGRLPYEILLMGSRMKRVLLKNPLSF